MNWPAHKTWRSYFRRTAHQLARGTRGAEIAETAMIMPLLFMMLMAIFWFGQAFRIYTTITHAARQGARAAVAPVCATCYTASLNLQQTEQTNAVTAVNNALTAANLNPNQVQAPSPIPSYPACAGQTVVNSCFAGSTATNICVEFNVQLSVQTNGSPGTCGTAVSFGYKYPYSFGIPYTSLNLNNITLPASSQMRLETQ